LTDFPRDELETKPEPVETGRDQVKGSVEIKVLRKFETLAKHLYPNLNQPLDEALSKWVAKNKPEGWDDFDNT
jgi:hypothetical protein